MKNQVVVLLSALTGVISLDIFANENFELADYLSSCTQIENNEQRLLCFDKLAQNSVVHSNAIKVTNEAVAKVARVKSEKTKQVDNFSKDDLKKTSEEQGPESITATISQAKQLIRGQWVLHLENEQKWQQLGSTKINLKAGDSIRLKKGSLGAVYLNKEGSHRRIRVKRLK